MSSIHISYPNILEIAAKGVRRTAVFMGLGLNAAYDSNFTAYQLTRLAPIQLVSPDADEKTITHYKEQFALWIITCGLRELVDTFAIFLDEIHHASLLISVSVGEASSSNVSAQRKKFHFEGMTKKLDLLKRDFDICPQNPEALNSIHQTRNCLTHRQGIVGPKDCFGGQSLIVKWSAIDFYVKTPSDEVILPFPIPQEGIFVSEGGEVKAGFSERQKAFPLHTVVNFNPRELAEICHFMLISTDEIIKAAEAYATKKGIRTSEPPKVEE